MLSPVGKVSPQVFHGLNLKGFQYIPLSEQPNPALENGRSQASLRSLARAVQRER